MKPPKRILIAEGNTAELALATKRAVGATTAWRFAAALRSLAPTLDIDVIEPYFSDYDEDAVDLAAYDGFVVTGSGVSWSGADAEAAPFWRLFEKTFAAGTPAFGSCWGMQTAAVALGGAAGAGPNGIEAGVARDVRPVGDHPMTAGRRRSFDVIAMHRDDVTRLPDGAVATATSAHTNVQAFAYENGDAQVWGVQYHPECDLMDAAHWLSAARRLDPDVEAPPAKDLRLIAEDPAFYARLAAKHRIGLDIIDRSYHMTELSNWLTRKVGA